MKKWKKIRSCARMAVLVCWILAAGSAWSLKASGAETEEMFQFQQEILDGIGLSDVDEAMRDILGEEPVSLESWVLMLLEGKLPLTKETLQKRIQDSLYGAWSQQKKTAGYVFGLAVSSCAFSGFVGILAKSQAAKMAVSMLYFLMITVLVQVTAGFSSTAEETVGKMVSFLQVLMPTYLAVSVMAKGSLGSAAFYELMLGALGMLQSLLRYVVIPLADLYLLTTLLGNLSEKNRFSRMSELLKQAVDWSLKTIIVFVAGLQTVQNLILPAVDAFQRSLLTKAGSAIPAVGGLFGSVTELFFGSAALIRSALGAAGLLLLALICMTPLIYLGVGALVYQVLGAILQPAVDERMSACFTAAGESIWMLFKAVAVTAMLLFVSLALTSVSLGG